MTSNKEKNLKRYKNLVLSESYNWSDCYTFPLKDGGQFDRSKGSNKC